MVLYPPPTRPWLYCRVCGVRLTREPIDVPFPGHESWCSQEKWRRIVYKACCRPLHRWLQRWRRLVFKAAQSLFPSMGDFSERPRDLSPARPSSLPPRSAPRARPAKLQPVPRQDLERFARRLQGWTEKHPPFRKGWTDPRGNHICGSGHIHSRENLASAWHDGHAVPRA